MLELLEHDRGTLMPFNAETVGVMIDNVDKKHEEAHQRLRKTYAADKAAIDIAFDGLRALAVKNSTRIEALQTEMNRRFDEAGTRSIDAMKIVMTPRAVGTIVLIVATLLGGVYAMTLGLRMSDAAMQSAIQNILTKMDSQHEVSDANARLSQAALANLSKDVDDIKRQQALQAYEIQNLKDMTQGRTKK